MLNIKSLIAATVLTSVAALSFAAGTEAPKADATPVAAAADPAAKPIKKVHKHKKVKKNKAGDNAAAGAETAK